MGPAHELLICLSKGCPEEARPMLIEGEMKKRVLALYKGKLSPKEYLGHPTQKPVGLYRYIIENRTDEGDVVLDPFIGSGTLVRACRSLKRNYIGCDIMQAYVDLALEPAT